MTEIAFAPADIADRRQIMNLLWNYFNDRGMTVTDGRLAGIVDGVLHHPDHGFFHVARSSSIVVGLVCVHYGWSLEHYGKSAWVDDLYVRADFRRHGVGTQLILAAIERARRAGCHAVDFEVDMDHEWAAELAERQGFQSLERKRWVLNLKPVRV